MPASGRGPALLHPRPRTRRLALPGGETVLLSDTVGFVRKLPHQLVEAFRSTLEVVGSADLLVHVVDARPPIPRPRSTPSGRCSTRSAPGASPSCSWSTRPTVHPPGAARANDYPGAVVVSALTGEGIDQLLGPSATSCGWATGWSNWSSRLTGVTSWPPSTGKGKWWGRRPGRGSPWSRWCWTKWAGPGSRVPGPREPGSLPPGAGWPASSPPPYPYDRLERRAARAERSGRGGRLSIGTPATRRLPPCWRPWPPPAPSGATHLDGLVRLRAGRRRLDQPTVRRRARPSRQVAACVGTKEFVASTAQYLRLRHPVRDTVLYPAVSYPTYAMGAILAGAGRWRSGASRGRPRPGLGGAGRRRPGPHAVDRLPVQSDRPAHRHGRGGRMGPLARDPGLLG